MHTWIVAFGLGLITLAGIQDSPPTPVLYVLATVAGLSLFTKWRGGIWVSGVGAGFLWGVLHFNAWQEGRLPEGLQGQTVILSGTVIEVQNHDPKRQKITFWVDCFSPYSQFKPPLSQSNSTENCFQPFRVAQLSWYAPYPTVVPGQHWQIAAKLKWGHGFRNPGGFDYERWLMQQGIQAVGYVRDEIKPQLLERPLASGLATSSIESAWGARWKVEPDLVRARLNGIRQQVKQGIFRFLPRSEFRGIIAALVMGDRQDLSPAQRQVLRDTGTAHLMAISGLHIGLMAGLAYWVVKGLIGFFPALIARWPLQKWALLSACVVATGYAGLAGFSTPTLRAMFMLYVFSFYRFRDLPLVVFKPLLVAGLLVLWVDPFDIFSAGFWLSFVAVGVIFWCVQGQLKSSRLQRMREGSSTDRTILHSLDVPKTGIRWLGNWFVNLGLYLRHWGALQWGVFIGLLPASLFFLGQVSILAPLINFVVIPLFGWLVVPLSLLATALMTLNSPLAQLVFTALDQGLQLLWPLFEWGASQSEWVIQQPLMSPPVLLVLSFSVLLTLAARGWPLKSFGLLLGLALMVSVLPRFGPAGASLLHREVIPKGGLNFTLLDVGQGLSAVIRTRNHRLIYDLGPRYGENLDASEAVVLPYLNRLGLAHVDGLILSHDDSDHTGGFKSFGARMALAQVFAPLNVQGRFADDLQNKAVSLTTCSEIKAWQWDDVYFMVYAVGPPKKTITSTIYSHGAAGQQVWSDNNQSCMLKIWGDGFSVLIPGDIEKKAENALLRAFPRQVDVFNGAVSLEADILVVPHHGSRTSSSASFLQAVQPKHGLISAGYLNRFRHPSDKVVDRFQQRGIQLFRTDQGGALQYRLRPGQSIEPPSEYRREARKLWHHP